jgi:hypothetical protein
VRLDEEVQAMVALAVERSLKASVAVCEEQTSASPPVG